MQQKIWRSRWCHWVALGVVTATMSGCAPLAEHPERAEAPLQSFPALKSSDQIQLKPTPRPVSEPSTTAPLMPDAYARSSYRDKGLGIKANKPADAAKADTPEDDSKYELNPPPPQSDQSGLASWYGGQFHGRKTASGERFDSMDMTAAHKTLPFGSRVCVRSSVTGKTVVVRINDRGPFAPGRVIDLSKAAAQELGMLGLGIKPVELWQLDAGEEECPTRLAASNRKGRAAPIGAAAEKTRASKRAKATTARTANKAQSGKRH